uniref:Uncharacterized protein n=1 Tax=Knipowitschia caucasica TaxID=637954 RepID=A0AAV2JEU9_KNICA
MGLWSGESGAFGGRSMTSGRVEPHHSRPFLEELSRRLRPTRDMHRTGPIPPHSPLPLSPAPTFRGIHGRQRRDLSRPLSPELIPAVVADHDHARAKPATDCSSGHADEADAEWRE